MDGFGLGSYIWHIGAENFPGKSCYPSLSAIDSKSGEESSFDKLPSHGIGQKQERIEKI